MSKVINTIVVDLTPILPGGINGGAKIFVLELLLQLARMVPETQFKLLTHESSHEELAIMDMENMSRLMVIKTPGTSSPKLGIKGIAFRVFPHLPGRIRRIVGRIGYKMYSLLKRRGSNRLLRDLKADLLFCPFTAPTYFESGIPTVCVIYDLQYITHPDFFSAADGVHRHHVFIEACRRATKLTAISDYSRQSAITHGKLNFDRIKTIHLRMAQRIVSNLDNKDILERLSLKPQQYLLYPANFWKHKNHEMLLTAFGMVCHAGLGEDVKLVCTGAPGPRQIGLEDAARNMNLGDRVLFPGYLKHDELETLMSHCGGLIFPSLYEGFGLPVLEAMSAGVPVACSNTTSLPEIAADAAILFNPTKPTEIAQAMLMLLGNEELRETLIKKGRERAVAFSDTKYMASEYWALFQEACSSV